MKLYKIYWFCFKRQLLELYYLLISENYISCSSDDFIAHFTGKKFIIEKDYAGKLQWNKDINSLFLTFVHLSELNFIDAAGGDLSVILNRHFKNIPKFNSEQLNKYMLKAEAKNLKAKLKLLFPASTGYRCKTRLFYKERNKKSISAVLAGLNI